jgi:hypothetical protein
MMKVTIYIEKTDFDEFFVWVNRLNHGILTSAPVKYTIGPEGLKKPLQLSLDPSMYTLIQDAENDIKTLQVAYGELDIKFEPLSKSWELRTIQDVSRNARRYDMEANVIYSALHVMTQVPGISPAEAMIISEREWIGSLQNEPDSDI